MEYAGPRPATAAVPSWEVGATGEGIAAPGEGGSDSDVSENRTASET
jgi:hypothetical protein